MKISKVLECGFPQKPEEINSDRFYLLFGICIEALSNRRSADLTLGEVGSCLKALKALLDHVWTRTEVLSKVHLLLIELCNVLHRTILTRDSPTVHLLAMDVLKLVLATTKVSGPLILKVQYVQYVHQHQSSNEIFVLLTD